MTALSSIYQGSRLDHALSAAVRVYGAVLGRPQLLLRFGGVLLVLAFAVAWGQAAIVPTLDTTMRWFVYFPTAVIAGGWVSILYSVRWHRFIVFGERSVGLFDVRFTRRELVFLWRTVQLTAIPVSIFGGFAIAALTLALPMPMVMILGATATLTVFYAYARLGLTIPAAAIGRPSSLGESWRDSDARQLVFTMVFVLVSVPFFGGLALVDAFPFDSALANSVVHKALWLIAAALNAAVLSFNYLEVYGSPAAEAPAD